MMKYVIEKWYGDGCPSWTWPLTALLIGAAIGFAAQSFA